MIGGEWTFLAFKNSNSFGIGTNRKGLILIENSARIFCQRFSLHENKLRGLIYIDHLDCYLLNLCSKIFRKDLTDQPPYLYMDIFCRYRAGAASCTQKSTGS